MDNQFVRLNKFLAERLGVSRREADELIRSGQISINGETAQIGDKVDKTSKVCYNKKDIPVQTDYLYLAFNKPIGYVCSRRAQGDTPTIYSLLPDKYHKLKTVGRLDKDSSGLILLTNDGDFAFQMTHPKFRKQKIYEVNLDKSLEPLHQQMISDYGVALTDGLSRFKIINNQSFNLSPSKSHHNDSCSLHQTKQPQYTVFLTEGRNRQIRRTFAALGYKVTKLHRISFGKYELGNLATGKYIEVQK